MDSSVNPQPTDGHIRISHEIHRELIRRKFSQRQRDVIDFILTLSWGCGKPSAIIPELKNFEEAGIRKNHIREVLDGLVTGKVILWDELMNIFQFNKHYDQWTIQPISASAKRLNELINLNLARPSPNLLKLPLPERGIEFPYKEPCSLNGNPVPKKGTGFPNEESGSGKSNGSVPKKGTGFLNEEASSSRKGNQPVPKRGTVTRDYPSRIKGSSISKASIKAIFKKDKRTTTTTITTNTFSELLNDEYSFQSIVINYKNNFLAGNKVLPFDEEDLESLFSDFGGEWLYTAMKTAYRGGSEKRNLAYVRGILNGFRERGGMNTQLTKTPILPSALPVKPIRQGQGDSWSGKGRSGKPHIEIFNPPLLPPTPEEIALQQKLIAEYRTEAETYGNGQLEHQG